MKNCTKCGIELPATSEYFGKDTTKKDGLRPSCKQCRKLDYQNNKKDILKRQALYYEGNKEKVIEYAKKYAKENKEKIVETRRKHYQNNKSEINRKYREYYRENKESFAEYNQKYYLNNKEKINEHQRIYYKENKNLLKPTRKKWRKENIERVYQLNHARRVRERGLPHTLTNDDWVIIKDSFDNRCAYCGTEKELTRDHFIPVAKNGEYTKNNIIPACRACNGSKQDKSFFEWYPSYRHYSKKREQKILRFLNYNQNKEQQLALL